MYATQNNTYIPKQYCKNRVSNKLETMDEETPHCTWNKEELNFSGKLVPIYLPDDITLNLKLQTTDAEHAFHDHPYSLESIVVQSVDWFGGKIGFVKTKANVEHGPISNAKSSADSTKISKNLPGIAFLRGGSVAMLMILRPRDSRDERYVVLTEQPRLPAGSLRFLEIPAGMLDDEKNLSGAAAREIEEKTGFKIPHNELVDMTELALANADPPESNLKPALYPSPGGCDEYIALFLWEKELDRLEIEDLRGRLTGERKQSEMITLHIRDYEDVWRQGARDAKTLAAWALYESLSRSGELQRHQKRKQEGSAVNSSSRSSRSRSFRERSKGKKRA
ncbi:Nudix hydrolase 14, chloroplastic [Cytospora mali]|uniref:Nudix hydrolase 14, chloroplastic n=1 Tax=Cytospora mali TaxID=578113 RepID=A0A194W0U8_CYTMA|nr:Nudix hydrolase 14, chloroplastic [Valsa mali]